MAGAKRKNEAPQQTRIDYDAGAGGGYDAPDASAGIFSRADPHTLSRRKVAVAVTPTAGSSGGAGISGPTLYRRERYHREMGQLNFEFAEWAKREEAKYVAAIKARGAGETQRGPTRFFLSAIDFYTVRARTITEKYCSEVGDVLALGSGDTGQLGWPEDKLNEEMTFAIPRVVKNLRGLGVIALAAGGQHNLALAEDGKAYSWGCNDEGCLGRVDWTEAMPDKIDTGWVPGLVKGFLPSPAPKGAPYDARPDESIIAIATGDCHSICLSDTGRVYFMGAYKDNEGRPWRDEAPEDDTRVAVEEKLRTAEEVEENRPAERAPRGRQRWPVHVNKLPGKAVQIACGNSFNVAVLENDSLVSWGLGETGEMARPLPKARFQNGKYNMEAISRDFLIPKPVVFGGPMMKREVVSVGCGDYHLLVCCRDQDSKSSGGTLAVYSAGNNNYGQLGRGVVGEGEYKSLERIDALDDEDIVKACGGMQHSMCLDATGKNLFTFGRGDSGQLGRTPKIPTAGWYDDVPRPIMLERGAEVNPVISQISAGGGNFSMAMTEDGDVYSWGFGETGALGHGQPPAKEMGDLTNVPEDETLPKKMNFMKRTNAGERKRGAPISSGKATAISCGGQHAIILAKKFTAP